MLHDVQQEMLPEDDSVLELNDQSDLYELACEWSRLRQEEEELEAALKKKTALRAAVESALFQRMSEAGIQRFKAVGIGTISQRRDYYAKVVDQDLAEAWLMANGHEELIKRQINVQRLRSLVKEREGQGQELPAGVDYWIKESCTLKRS